MTVTFKRNFESYHYLPLFAKLAIECLNNNSDFRTDAKLDEMIDAYARTYGETCDTHTRESAHHICAKRFWNMNAQGDAQ
jgi:hypothetical protein